MEVEGSGACDHCYARELALRFGYDVWGSDKPRRFFGDRVHTEPLKWDRMARESGRPWRVFCMSMGDLFERLPRAHPQFDEMDRVRKRFFEETVPATPHLTWQLLTKRAQNIMTMVPESWHRGFPPNVWVGVTAEDQGWFEKRWRRLREVPAVCRFLSVEPMLTELDVYSSLSSDGERQCPRCRFRLHKRLLRASDGAVGIDSSVVREVCPNDGATLQPVSDLQWVIIGAESGPERRPMQQEWVEDLIDQCRGAGVAVFVKQIQAQGAGPKGTVHLIEQFPPALRVKEFPNVPDVSLYAGAGS